MASLPTKKEGNITQADQTVARPLPGDQTDKQYGLQGAAQASNQAKSRAQKQALEVHRSYLATEDYCLEPRRAAKSQ